MFTASQAKEIASKVKAEQARLDASVNPKKVQKMLQRVEASVRKAASKGKTSCAYSFYSLRHTLLNTTTEEIVVFKDELHRAGYTFGPSLCCTAIIIYW